MFIPVAIVILGTLLSKAKGSSPKALPAKPGTRVATVTKKALAIKPGVPLLQQKAVIARVREVAMKGSAVQVAKLAGVVWKKGEATAARKLLRIAKKKARVEVNAKVSGDLIGASYGPHQWLLEYQREGGRGSAGFASWLRKQAATAEPGLASRMMKYAHHAGQPTVAGDEIVAEVSGRHWNVPNLRERILYKLARMYRQQGMDLRTAKNAATSAYSTHGAYIIDAVLSGTPVSEIARTIIHNRDEVSGRRYQYGRPLHPMFKRRLEEKVQRLLEQQGVSHPESFHRAQALVRKQGFSIPTLQSTTAPVSEIAREIVYGRVGADEEFEPVETFMVDAKTDADDRPVIPEYEYPEISGCHKLQLV